MGFSDCTVFCCVGILTKMPTAMKSNEQFKQINAAYARLTSAQDSDDDLDDIDLDDLFMDDLFAEVVFGLGWTVDCWHRAAAQQLDWQKLASCIASWSDTACACSHCKPSCKMLQHSSHSAQFVPVLP